MVNQYSIRLEACKGLESLINTCMKYGLFREWQSKFNTPILLAKKHRSEESVLVRDLRAINQITMSIHPSVPNSYTLLVLAPETNAYFTFSYLKDGLFYIPVDKQRQTIFAFEWEIPIMGRNVQLRWTVLPQGFRNSPTPFGNILAKDLEQW